MDIISGHEFTEIYDRFLSLPPLSSEMNLRVAAQRSPDLKVRETDSMSAGGEDARAKGVSMRH